MKKSSVFRKALPVSLMRCQHAGGRVDLKDDLSPSDCLLPESCLLIFHIQGVGRHLSMLMVAVGSTRCINITESLTLFISGFPFPMHSLWLAWRIFSFVL